MKKTLCVICALVMTVILSVTVFADSVDICGVPIDASHTPTPLSAKGTLGQTFKPKTAFNTITVYAPTWNKTDSGFTFKLYVKDSSGKLLFQQTVANVADGETTFIVGDRMGGMTYYFEMSNPVDQVGLWTRPTDVYPDGSAYINGVAKNYDYEFDVVYDNTHIQPVGNEAGSSSSTPSSSSQASSVASSSSQASSVASSSSQASSVASSSSQASSAAPSSSQASSVASSSSQASSAAPSSSQASSVASSSSQTSSAVSSSSQASSVAESTPADTGSVAASDNGTGTATTASSASKGSNPYTGDASAIGFAVLALLASGAVIAVKSKNKK